MNAIKEKLSSVEDKIHDYEYNPARDRKHINQMPHYIWLKQRREELLNKLGEQCMRSHPWSSST